MIRTLHLYALRSKTNNRIIDQVRAQTARRVKSETLMVWKIFKLQEGTRKLSIESAFDQHEMQLKRKVMQAFQCYQNR